MYEMFGVDVTSIRNRFGPIVEQFGINQGSLRAQSLQVLLHQQRQCRQIPLCLQSRSPDLHQPLPRLSEQTRYFLSGPRLKLQAH